MGDWIYLIALNLIVLDRTHSPFAVAVLYILKPVTAVFTNVWSGSLVDRANKRRIMILLDFLRTLLLLLLYIHPSLWLVFTLMFIVNMGGSAFKQASIVFLTRLIPSDQRKRFNALQSVIQSGAFLLGPAVAGGLFIISSPLNAILINAISFLFSGCITILLPDVEKNMVIAPTEKLSLTLLRNDWIAVRDFASRNSYIIFIYFLFSWILAVMPAAIDSLEAAFSKQVLHLTNSLYGFLVSLAGIGFLAGAFSNTALVKKIPLSFLIGISPFFVSANDMIYSFSDTFITAAFGFFVLSFFQAYANTGFLTFYQNHIPVEIMGRAGSVFELAEGVLVIIITIAIGISAHGSLFSLWL
jgi:MFS family permease